MSDPTQRYEDFVDDTDADNLLRCLDCSTEDRATVVPRDEVSNHDLWHTASRALAEGGVELTAEGGIRSEGDIVARLGSDAIGKNAWGHRN